jgi:imidazolonepropionase-like amidohydrolase
MAEDFHVFWDLGMHFVEHGTLIKEENRALALNAADLQLFIAHNFF